MVFHKMQAKSGNRSWICARATFFDSNASWGAGAEPSSHRRTEAYGLPSADAPFFEYQGCRHGSVSCVSRTKNRNGIHAAPSGSAQAYDGVLVVAQTGSPAHASQYSSKLAEALAEASQRAQKLKSFASGARVPVRIGLAGAKRV